MKNLAVLRKEYGLSQQKLASEIGLARNTICQYESGNRVPDVSTLVLLADYFGVSIDYLLGRDYVISSFQVFVEICAKEGKSVFEVAKEFEITDEQLTQWKNGIEPSKRTLWAIANTYHYYSNPFDKTKEKSSIIERPVAELAEKYKHLFYDDDFMKIAKVYAAAQDIRVKGLLVGYFIATAKANGVDTSIIGY